MANDENNIRCIHFIFQTALIKEIDHKVAQLIEEKCLDKSISVLRL